MKKLRKLNFPSKGFVLLLFTNTHIYQFYILQVFTSVTFNPLSANPEKWSNTLMNLALKGLRYF